MAKNKKQHIGLIFGGNSSEHDVSKRSAHNIFDAMDKDKYQVSLFLMTKSGYILGNKDSAGYSMVSLKMRSLRKH